MNFRLAASVLLATLVLITVVSALFAGITYGIKHASIETRCKNPTDAGVEYLCSQAHTQELLAPAPLSGSTPDKMFFGVFLGLLSALVPLVAVGSLVALGIWLRKRRSRMGVYRVFMSLGLLVCILPAAMTDTNYVYLLMITGPIGMILIVVWVVSEIIHALWKWKKRKYAQA